MSLRDLAKADAAAIMRDSVSGFGWPFTLTAPTGAVYSLVGRMRDIHLADDVETGQKISLRQVSVTYVTSDVSERVTTVRAGTPWKVTAVDMAGEYRVADTMPDNVLGLTILILEELK